MARLSILGAATLGIALAIAVPARAQKNSGPLLPMSPPSYSPPAYSPPAYSPPAYTSPSYAPRSYAPAMPRPIPPAATPRPGNPDAERLAQSLPLDPQTRELRDQMPSDPRGTERRLGLREPRGPATDMRGRTPSPREIIDALAPR